MVKMFVSFSGLLMLAIVKLITVDAISYCSNHTYVSSQGSTFMQFTKETVNQEYAVEGQFKALHCCAKGYRSIEW